MANQTEVVLYPLKFSTLALEKVWGGHKLAQRYGEGLPADRRLGEIWLVWDQLLVDNGAWRGETLAELVRAHSQAILGSRFSEELPAFPLLIKLIDARKKLSVQVHPDDAYAQVHEGEPYGKAEAWYIIDAEADACLIHGVHTALSRADAEVAIASGTLRDLMEYVRVEPGDVIMNPPGTIHAITEGILLYEVQQSSDLTYRLYDWDRNDPNRPLHLSKSLDVADLLPLNLHKVTPIALEEPGGSRTVLAACNYFAAELIRICDRILGHPAGTCFHVLTVLRGTGQLSYGPSLDSVLSLSAGDSVLVPAGISEYEVRAEEDLLEVVRAWVPDLLQEIVTPLRQRGVAWERIVQLGGEPRNSDLARYIGEPE